MAYQSIFKRYEMKYLITQAQKAALLEAMKEHMRLDQYGRSQICNLYYDTPTFLLIRRSMEKPVYKEKLRLRSYGPIDGSKPVYLELKKKYNSVVYKRRICLPYRQVPWFFRRPETVNLGNTGLSPVLSAPLERIEAKLQPLHDSQIGREIAYAIRFYENLKPRMYISYEREAYYSLDGSDFRVTFDEEILWRKKDLSLSSVVYGTPILEPGQTLLEIKTAGGIPLWMSACLTELSIRRTSFSKYGKAYEAMKKSEKLGDYEYEHAI